MDNFCISLIEGGRQGWSFVSTFCRAICSHSRLRNEQAKKKKKDSNYFWPHQSIHRCCKTMRDILALGFLPSVLWFVFFSLTISVSSLETRFDNSGSNISLISVVCIPCTSFVFLFFKSPPLNDLGQISPTSLYYYDTILSNHRRGGLVGTNMRECG